MADIDVGAPPSVPNAEAVAAPRRRRGRRWLVIAAVLVLLTGGGITAVAVSFHYLRAPDLDMAGGYGWLPPDNLHSRSVRVGPYDGLVIPARPNHWQTFSFQVENRSSVTQTILGLPYSNGPAAEPERLTVSATSTARGDEMLAKYTSEPVAIPPGGIHTVRLSHYAGTCEIWGHGNSRGESYTELDLRVRVGAFTRTEVVSFDGAVFELRGTGSAC
jgi:hypothetical protein